jgi:hypothetical protein
MRSPRLLCARFVRFISRLSRNKKLVFTSIAASIVALATLLFVVVPHSTVQDRVAAMWDSSDGDKIPPALASKLAKFAKFSPGDTAPSSDNPPEGPSGWADQDWLMHSIDGEQNSPPAFEQFATARNDWFGLLGRPAFGTGKWVPYGPTNGMNDLTNLFRDRTVYNAGTETFGGRTVHGVISPACQPAPGECTLWIAASNGGVWRTDNALAVDDPATPEYEGPAWEFVSGTFENQNASALELDPNDPNHKTIWAGTGEPNACGSGCEVGVGIYVSKDGRKGWRGPLGAEHFFGRAVGSIEVKPGDSKTVFAASGRATRGISNTCCGGTDALVPRAPHFGVYRSKDEGHTWELVNQGAEALCTASTPDAVSLNQTACSPRGARRIKFDPVDPNTIYASFFARGIWRSRSNGDPGTWEQIMAPKQPAGAGVGPTTERDEFDVVALPSGETRMYVGAGGGNYSGTGVNAARLRVNDAVRNAPAATVQTTWVDKQQFSFAYCEPQCSYDNYVYAPANPENAPNSGATADTVYLSGANQYSENNTATGRSNGRAVLLSTDGGNTFTDMTEDNRSSTHPGALHPDHHALVVNPNNWRQFFDMSDGGVNRSDGVFVNDSADCLTPPHSFAIAANQAFCAVVLSRVPQTLTAINRGLRTIHFYQLEYDRTNPDRLTGGTQDNGSWDNGPTGDRNNWLNINVADGGHNAFDAPAPGRDEQYAVTGWQSGQIEVRYDQQSQYDVNWVADTMFYFYSNEQVPFIGNTITDPVVPGTIFTAREHVFRSQFWGRNEVFGPGEAGKAAHRAVCNVWSGTGDVDGDGDVDLADVCDSFKPLGDPGPNGRLTSTTYGADKAGGFVAVNERAYSDTNTLWVATSTGRIFVSKNADNLVPAAVVFDRLDNDPTATNSPPRYPTSIFVDRTNPNHAWITYSGYNAKTPNTPGHVFEVFYAPNASTFINRDGHKINGYGDIPANSIIVTNRGTYYVATDYGVVVKEPKSDVWKMAAAGLPNIDVADLVYVPERDVLYAVTHGQGAWQLKVQ